MSKLTLVILIVLVLLILSVLAVVFLSRDTPSGGLLPVTPVVPVGPFLPVGPSKNNYLRYVGYTDGCDPPCDERPSVMAPSEDKCSRYCDAFPNCKEYLYTGIPNTNNCTLKNPPSGTMMRKEGNGILGVKQN
jgi:hypothetical protein